MKLGEAMYKAQAGGAARPAASRRRRSRRGEGVVDAEFEEVDDDRKKSA